MQRVGAVVELHDFLGLVRGDVAQTEVHVGRRTQALTQHLDNVDITLLGGDFWDALLRSTYGAIFGKGWFRQKEMELMRAGYRGPRVVKVYGVASLVFTAVLLIVAVIDLYGDPLASGPIDGRDSLVDGAWQ